MRLDRWALVLIFVLLTGSTAFAETAITCHCFKDRSYDPQQPEKVADYLLATTQNSFFAEVFGIKKFEVVKSRMSGTSAEDLWLAYYLAGRGDIEPEALLNARALDGSWAVVVNKLDLPTQNLGEELRTALASGGEDTVLAAAVADEAAVYFLKADPAAIRALRSRKATTQEVLLSVFLACQLQRPANDLFAEVKGQKTSWGALVASLGITPEQIEPTLAKMMK